MPPASFITLRDKSSDLVVSAHGRKRTHFFSLTNDAGTTTGAATFFSVSPFGDDAAEAAAGGGG